MNFVPLVELTRNGIQECVHMGALAVTDTEGRVLAQVGNPHWLCFTRSTLKAMQALPLVQSGGVAHFGFTPTELAMMCASHNGEEMHVEQVSSILRKSGTSTRQMRCGCHVPYRFTFFDRPLPTTYVTTTAAASTAAFWRIARSTACPPTGTPKWTILCSNKCAKPWRTWRG